MFFNGLCMIPNASWHAKMELEHWVRYSSFYYLFSNKSILDCASGEGYGSALLAKIAKDVVGVDISIENIQHARNKYVGGTDNLQYIQGDCTKKLNFDEGSFDVITSFETFEHVDDPVGMLVELKRLLAQDGVLIFSTPRPNLNKKTGKPVNPHHVMEYTDEEVSGFMEGIFEFVKFAGQMDAYPFEIHREYVPYLDRFMLVIAGNTSNAVMNAYEAIQSLELCKIKTDLSSQHIRSLMFNPRPPRVIFVPLDENNPHNPADVRRTFLLQKMLRNIGVECAVMKKEDAVTMWSDVIISQNRDYRFWCSVSDKLKLDNRLFVFSSSDLLFPKTLSQAHHYASYSIGGLPADYDENFLSAASQFFEQVVDFLFCGSQMQFEHLQTIFDIKHVQGIITNDPIDEAVYPSCEQSREIKNEIRIFWEGYFDNVPYLSVCVDSLSSLAHEVDVTLVVATSSQRRNNFMGGADNNELIESIFENKIGIEFHEWSSSDVSSIMKTCHIGISPCFISGDPFGEAKPANKAIIMNHVGLPVIASMTKANSEYIVDGVNGFLVDAEQNWAKPIRTIIENPELYALMQQKSVEASLLYSAEKVANVLLDGLLGMINKKVEINYLKR